VAGTISALLVWGALAWLALLVFAPYMPPVGAAVVYALGSFVCHQLPERSFHLGSFQLPVCARCFGIYGGAALATATQVFPRLDHRTTTHRGLTTLIALLPTLVTVALEWAGIWRPSNLARALAGVPLGFAVAFVVTRAATVHYGGCASPRPTAPGRPPTHI
jgi:uncharacterized membrane protein